MELNERLPGGQPVNSDVLGPPQSQRLRPSDDELEQVMEWSADRASHLPVPDRNADYARGVNDAVAWCIGQSNQNPMGS